MTSNLPQIFFGGVCVIIAGLIAGSVAIINEVRKNRLELAKLTMSTEVEKARIIAYIDLWKCLDGISTFYGREKMVANLAEVQANLQQWYYARGGGLLIGGSAENRESTKSAFFVARHIKSDDPSEIWEAFHKLRRCLRNDLKIFESDADLEKEKERIRKMLKE